MVHVGETVSKPVWETVTPPCRGVFCDARPAEKERQQCAVFALCGTASCS